MSKLALGTVQFGTDYGINSGVKVDPKEVTNIISSNNCMASEILNHCDTCLGPAQVRGPRAHCRCSRSASPSCRAPQPAITTRPSIPTRTGLDQPPQPTHWHCRGALLLDLVSPPAVQPGLDHQFCLAALSTGPPGRWSGLLAGLAGVQWLRLNCIQEYPAAMSPH